MASGYRLFNLELQHKVQLSPSLMRCVFSGADIAEMRRYAPDQRIKLLFSDPAQPQNILPATSSWREHYQALPPTKRPLLRTYTLRDLCQQKQQAAVDFVLHGDNGPASRWVSRAQPGDKLQMVAPGAESSAATGGFEWSPDQQVKQVLLIADETALPAAAGILEQLAQRPTPPRVQAFFEVPLCEDCLPVAVLPFATVHWLPRCETATQIWGERLLSAVKTHFDSEGFVKRGETNAEGDCCAASSDWQSASAPAESYAWIAAESTAIKELRRYLLDQHRLDRQAISFMAYWSQRG